MSTRKWLWTGPLVAAAVNLVGAQPIKAEPLTPPMPAEVQYLEQARRVFAVSGDNTKFRGDGELLVDGRYACKERTTGSVGMEATMVSPVLTQLAFIYLCPT